MTQPPLPARPKLGGFGSTPVNMLVVAAAYTVFAVSLFLQSARWTATSAYHLLLELMPQPAWGAIFAVTAVLLTAGAFAWRRNHRWAVIVALTVAFALTNGWLLALVFRWATSPRTTPVTPVSWSAFDYLLIWAAARLDIDEVARIPVAGRPG